MTIRIATNEIRVLCLAATQHVDTISPGDLFVDIEKHHLAVFVPVFTARGIVGVIALVKMYAVSKEVKCLTE